MEGNAPSLAEQVAKVPQEPGCYLWKDAAGTVIYVGKAKNLRSRMRQYVTLSDEREKIPLMMSAVDSFDYVVVDNEHEALILERELIAQYKPYYNVDYKDDKTYPFIAIDKSERFPAIKYTREKHKRNTRYFGPYTDVRAARETIETLRKVVPICSSSCAEWRRCRRILERNNSEADLANFLLAGQGRPCFDSHVGKGPGVCIGAISEEDYKRNVSQVERFLAGSRKDIVDEIHSQMQEAAAGLDFEKAGRLKSRLEAISALEAKQQVVFPGALSCDLIGFYREETISCACVFVVREGKTIRTCEFILDKGFDIDEDELQSSFVKRYYEETSDIPRELCLSIDLADAELLSLWLEEKGSHKVQLHRPLRGEKSHLLSTAQNNAHHALMRYMVRTGYADERTNQALLELESALALDAPPMRIECFDISTLHGHFTVASMVVFSAGRPDKSQYRRFKIHAELEEANDFLSMSEVLGRRYAPGRMADSRFGSKPDLLVVDGGKPQLTAAIQQLNELGLDIPVCGLAKSDEEIFVPWDDTPIVLPSGSASLYLIKQVRDESHRFAITFHRQLRARAMTKSILDEIEGVGSVRKRALLRHFGSFKKLKDASAEEIAQVEGISEQLASTIYESLRAWDEASKQD